MSTLRAKKVEAEIAKSEEDNIGGNDKEDEEDEEDDNEGEAFLETSDTDSKGHPRTKKRKRKVEGFKGNNSSSTLYKGQLMAACLLACCLNMAFMEAVLR